MTEVCDVAAFLLAQGGPMVAMKVQKLIYYSQAWSLTLRGRPLFSAKIQAWTFGPVVYELYEQHRRQFVVASLPAGDPARLDADEAALVERVFSHYGQFDGFTLSQMTHSEAPWLDARRDVSPSASSSQEISHEAMRAYFSKQAVPFEWAGRNDRAR